MRVYTKDDCGYGVTPRQVTRVIADRLGASTPMVGMEVGVYVGNHARTMLENLPGITRMYLVDPWYMPVVPGVFPVDGPTARRLTEEQLAPFREKLVVIPHGFETVNMEAASLDFCYVDGEHEYVDAYHDIRKGWRLLRPGGILGGHDAKYHGVVTALHEFAKEYNLRVFTADNGRNALGDDEGWDWWVLPCV